jgi:hypothetical protein
MERVLRLADPAVGPDSRRIDSLLQEILLKNPTCDFCERVYRQG